MSATTLSVIYKEKIAEMPSSIDDMKVVNNYHKEALKYAVEELKNKNGKGKAKGKKAAVAEKDENGEEKEKKPPTEYQAFVKEYQKVIKEKFPDLPSNQRFGKIAEEWKKHKDAKLGAPSGSLVNNYMKVEEVSPPSTDNEEEPKAPLKAPPKEEPKSSKEEPDEESVEEPKVSKKKKNNLPPIKIPVNKM